MSLNFIKNLKPWAIINKKRVNDKSRERAVDTTKVSLEERWERAEIPLSDIYKILGASLSLCLLVMLILFACGFRYKTAKTAEGVKINFIGFVRDGSPYRGSLHFSDSTRAKIKGKNKTVTYSNGAVFKGSLDNLMPNGEGTLQNSVGIYDGEFVNGLLSGHGKCLFSSGASYEGDFKDGAPHGNGRIIYADGSNYEGQFENGQMQGSGLFIYTNGDYYQGDFYAGTRHGNGFYHWANGDRFNGEFYYSNITEKGTYTYN